MSLQFKQSTAGNFPFQMVDSTDSITGKTGLAPTVTISKNAGGFGSPGGSVTEIGNGWYNLALNTTDTATLGPLALYATAAGADPASPEAGQVLVDIPGGTVASVTGAVGSVTGAVGSVTGAVGSVTGNVGGNVVGSVASVVAGVTLAASAVQAIWDALSSALVTSGSIGKRLVDFITGDIYARIGAPSGVSISSDLAAVGTTGTNTFTRIGAPAGASIAADIAAVKTDTAAVKAKTDNLPAAPASTGDVTTVGTAVATLSTKVGTPAGASVSADVAAVKTDTAAIKAKTDNLPAAPASEGNVTAVGVAVLTRAAPGDAMALVAAQVPFKKNTALAGFTFPMQDSSGNPLTGLTVVAQRVIDGGAIATCTNAVAEVSNGLYKISFSAADLNGNSIAFIMSATGAVETKFTALTQ